MPSGQGRTLEQALAYYCAPSMVGIKSADLFSWPQMEGAELDAYVTALQARGITLRVMRRGGKRMLLLVYRRRCLERRLACPAVRGMLREAGYPEEGGVEALLDVLSTRLSGGAFPHEIGLSWATRRRTWRGSAAARGRITSSAAGGRSMATRRRPGATSSGATAAGTACAAAWSTRLWRSCFPG